MSYRVIATDCVGGDCPSLLLDPETGDVIVRGPEDGNPATEKDLRFPPAQFRRFVEQFLADGV